MKRIEENFTIGNALVQPQSRRPRSATSQSPRRGSLPRRSSQSPTSSNKRNVVAYDTNSKRSGQSTSPYYSRIERSALYSSAIQGSQFKEIYVSDKDYKLLQSAFSAQRARNAKGETPALRKFKKTYIGYVTVPEKPEGAQSNISTELQKAKSMSVANKGGLSSSGKSSVPIPQRNSRSLSPKRQMSNRKHSIRIVMPRQSSSIHQHQPESITYRSSLKHKGIEGTLSSSTSCDFLYDEHHQSIVSTDLETLLGIPETTDKASQITIPENKKPVMASRSVHCYFPPKPLPLSEQSDFVPESLAVESGMTSPLKQYSLHHVRKSRHFESHMEAAQSVGLDEKVLNVKYAQTMTPSSKDCESNTIQSVLPGAGNQFETTFSPSQSVDSIQEYDTQRALSVLKLPSGSRLSLLGSLDNVSRTKSFKDILINASEVIVVLMNTLFRESLSDSKSSKILSRSDLFKTFMQDDTRLEALEKARTIFENASSFIQEYAKKLKLSNSTETMTNVKDLTASKSDIVQNIVPPPTLLPANFKNDAKPNSSANSFELARVCCTPSAKNSFNSFPIENKPSLAKSQSKPLVLVDSGSQTGELPRSVLVNNSTETLSTYKPKFQVTVSTTPTSGLLHQTISGNDCEVNLTFMGTTKRISSLIASTRSNSKSIVLSPLQTVETVHKSFSFIAGRLTVVKFHMQHISQQLGIVAQEYMEGKHGHYSKSLKRSTAKLQGLNIFSGIITQVSKSFAQVFKRLLPGITIWKRLREIFKAQIIEYRLEDGLTKFIPPYSPHDMQQDENAITDLVKVLDDIDGLVEIGRNSLASISPGSTLPGVKMKKALRDVIERLVQAIEQMEVKQDIDLGALILASIWSTLLLAALEPADVPKVDSWMLQSILANVAKIDGLVNDICNIAIRLHFVANYLASKSLSNIKTNREASRVLEDKKLQIRRIPWYKRRVIHQVLTRAYSAQSIRTIDENGETEFRSVMDTQSEHATIENSQPPLSVISGDHLGNVEKVVKVVKEPSASSTSIVREGNPLSTIK